MALTLYDVTRVGLRGARCPVLQRVGYTSKIGPAFIWSAEFSEDGRALILGCWAGMLRDAAEGISVESTNKGGDQQGDQAQ